MRGVVLAVSLLLTLCTGCDTGSVIFSVSQLKDTHDTVGPYRVLAEVTDPDGVDQVNLVYRAGTTSAISVEMEELREGVFEGTIPGQPAGTTITYYVEAIDGDQSVRAPLSGTYSFKVLARACTADVDCGPGESCRSGSCTTSTGPCKTDADCGKGFRCDLGSGSCWLEARPCVLDEECLMGEVCDVQVLGECIPRPSCGGAETCPLDFVCDTSSGFCLRACMGTAQCGPGETCQGGACSGAISCEKAGDCPKSLSCDLVLGYCRPEGAGLCSKCVTDVDCGGTTDFCLVFSDGQYCGRDCSGEACPSGYTCSTEVDPPQCVPESGSCEGS